MAAKAKVLLPVHPNAGIQAQYREKIDRLVREMARSYEYWLRAQYRENPPAMALDAGPVRDLKRELSSLGKRWAEKMDAAAPKLAEWFAKSNSRRSQASLKKILADGGMTVDFKMTKAMRDVFDATVQENVSLIRSIGSEYHTQIEGIVMRSVSAGRDLEQMTTDLRDRYGVTTRRAAFIARDQNDKATANFVKVRQVEHGVMARWLHSAGGKEKYRRKTHVANSGKTYDPAKGWFDPDPKVRRRIWPGELTGCKCVSVSVVKGFS